MRSGKVVFAGRKANCGGYQVWVSHGSGLYSAYYHLRSYAVRKGKWVKSQSTRLGRVGESGCATGPHLHMEVWRGFPWASGSYRVSPWRYIDSGYWLPYRYR
jgi:murein DD-endopeptidase MepM/ murein hydrolase activator NlpD